MRQFIIHLSDKEHKKLKVASALRECTMADIVKKAVFDDEGEVREQEATDEQG